MSVFECNICLDSFQDPVVTLCGHLFCRPCLHKWLQIHPHHHECPVCKAPVDDDKLVPIYGKGSDLLLDIPSQQPQTDPVSPELPPELTYVRQDRSSAPRGLTCNRVFGAISSVWNLLFGVISSVWSIVSGVISSAWNILLVAMSSIWNILVSAISSAWNILVIIMSSIWNLLVSAISSAWNNLVIVMSSMWNLLVSAPSSLWNILVIDMCSVWNLLLDAIPCICNLADTECLWTPPHEQRNPLAFLMICFIGFILLYIRVSSWLS